MNKILTLCLFAFFSATLLAQVETLDLATFTSIDAAAGVEVSIHEGDSKAEINLIRGNREDLVVESKSGRLKIKFKSKKWGFGSNNRKAKIKVFTNGAIESVEASSGASVYSDITLNSDKFYGGASSGASISLGLEARSVELDVSSGASLSVDGTANYVNVDASSGASLNAAKLEARDVKADASSGASVKVWSTESIDADASSGASIRYKGNPKDKKISAGKYSGGSIREM